MPRARAEESRARMLEAAPAGFEERDLGDEVELAAYAAADEAAGLRRRLPGARAERVEPGWEDGWRRFHRPVRVGRVWVGPPWETPEPDALAVVVDPGRAFGTGAHPTTRLSLALLQEARPGSLVDLGCGSGVLAIAAAKLGFDPVIALDVDPAAVEATRANALANGVAVAAWSADVLVEPLPATDVAVANLERAAVEALAGRLGARRLVASGYLARDRLAAEGWVLLERREAEGWAADLLARAET